MALFHLAPVGEAGDVAGLQQSAITEEKTFGAGESTLQWFSGDVTFGGTLQVVVPNVSKGVVEADSLEAVVQANGPTLCYGACGKRDFSQVFEALNVRLIRFGLLRRWVFHGAGEMGKAGIAPGLLLACSCRSLDARADWLSFLGGGEFGQLLLFLLLGGVLSEIGSEFFGGEGFDQVAHTDVLEAGEIDAALHALTDVGDVVLEALERSDLALPDLFAAAHERVPACRA